MEELFEAIKHDGFSDNSIDKINNYITDIQNGTKDFPRFNISEHGGLCKGDSPLIRTSIVACYATASLRASCDAEGRQGQSKSRAEVMLLFPLESLTKILPVRY